MTKQSYETTSVIFVQTFYTNLFLVFVEHGGLEAYISEMCVQCEDKSYYCGVCGHQGSGKKQDIERHIESFHIETDPFPCNICGISCKTRRGYQRHVRTHNKN